MLQMLRNISTGYAIAGENRVMASIKKRRIPSAFKRLDLLYLFINFPSIKHIACLCNRSIAYLAGMKMNHWKSILHLIFKHKWSIVNQNAFQILVSICKEYLNQE